jgi:hypothetical protein
VDGQPLAGSRLHARPGEDRTFVRVSLGEEACLYDGDDEARRRCPRGQLGYGWKAGGSNCHERKADSSPGTIVDADVARIAADTDGGQRGNFFPFPQTLLAWKFE